MTEVVLGQTPSASQQRDAIHVAVAPVVAAVDLKPGEHVGFVMDDREHVGPCPPNNIGIVDPFLTGPVKRGERFWLLLYPKTIMSLRHDWLHPAFDAGYEKARSEAWLREYAKRQNCFDEPEQAYQRLIEGFECGEVYFHGTEMRRYDLEDEELLRHHVEIVLGRSIDFDDISFSCGC